MKTQRIPHRIIATAAVALTLLAFAPSLRAQVITPDPNLPVLYPTGFYATATQVFDQYHGAGLAVTLSGVQLQAFGPVARSGAVNEIENFTGQMVGTISVNGGLNSPFNLSGPETVDVFGKVGNTTGTFNTEMLALNLSGSSPLYGPFMLRESPTLASTGQTTITPLGGGLFRIDSFFDVFTELSVDGGQSWIPSDTSARVTLMGMPEPSVCALAGLGAGLLALRGARRLRK